MSLFEMIGTVLIGPLKILFDAIFCFAYSNLRNPGLAIIVLSLAMNIMVLPLYRRADAMQIQARDTENKLKDVVTHIKKTFSGDERMMILQTYYRQNHYNPLSVLTGSVSLLLEIPFFMAAYQFLSSVAAFYGTPFGPIADLGAPDGLIQLGSFSINLLPILMTLINVVSSSIYLKGFPLKAKIQLYGMALFFLVFLYNAPAALVFYWTLNNTFSLVKNIFGRIENARKISHVILGITGAALLCLGITMDGRKYMIVLMALGIALQLPWMVPVLSKKSPYQLKQATKADAKLFVIGAVFMTILVGVLIPSTYIAASPQEYIDIEYIYSPAWYVASSLCLASGTFLVWMGVVYWLANPTGKRILSRLVLVASGVMLVNYLFFGRNLGVLNPDLFYVDGMSFAEKEQVANLMVVSILIVGLGIVVRKYPFKMVSVALVGTIALACMGTLNLVKIVKITEQTKEQISNSGEGTASFTMTPNGKNVVVIMLDRAIGPYVPYLMEENPGLVEQFDGFTYYPNTMSYGGFTNFATPALYGGYEYTPININLREEERLADKHNEALKVVPAILTAEDYSVTVIDPSYAGYSWIPNLSIYKDMPNVKAFLASGRFNDVDENVIVVRTQARNRNFFLFSLMKALPVSMQPLIYNHGQYRATKTTTELSASNSPFLNAYNVLKNMTTMTEIVSDSRNTYLFLRSDLTHEPMILQEPDFEPAPNVDNSSYYPAEGKTVTAGDSRLLLDTESDISHYHVNMAALIQLGNWFDYLRENGVYDNTRIILVSDHGKGMGMFSEELSGLHDIGFYQAMLLVKDFYAEGFHTSDAFMTNADVPLLSMKELIEEPVNPFTGKTMTDAQKTEKQYVLLSWEHDIGVNNGNQFLASEWASVSGDVRDKSNWVFYPEVGTLPKELQK